MNVLHTRPAAVVFGHEHDDPEVNAENIPVIPTDERVECVHEAIFDPHLVPVAASQISHRPWGGPATRRRIDASPSTWSFAVRRAPASL